ncbi:MAG: hypothetical protein HZB70_02405 [Candidatus Berkelbacteria bacterium]|nr:MAG: hypothetical protein HZB70_02405 [Candidatus Berkelbacteria bacterium]QQG51838.1 MAG: hypothetical protein HY845_00590 [Candidatus Berkelbacteria bacterium]
MRELRYLLRRHSLVNEKSKDCADEKATILKRILEIQGLYVESARLPDLGGEAAFDLEELAINPELAEQITGPEVHQIARDQSYFAHRVTIQLSAFYGSPEELSELMGMINSLAPRWKRDGDDRHSAVVNEAGYRSLCDSHGVPYPDPAIEPIGRSIKWMKPAKDPKPPRRSARLKRMIESFVKEKLSQRRRSRSR